MKQIDPMELSSVSGGNGHEGVLVDRITSYFGCVVRPSGSLVVGTRLFVMDYEARSASSS